MDVQSPIVERVSITAQARTPSADAQIIEVELVSPVDVTVRDEDNFRLELCLTPRFPNARLSFLDYWPAERFEAAGKLYLLPPGQDLRIRTDPGGRQRMIICQCRTQLFDTLLDDGFRWTDKRLETSSNITNTTLKHLLLRLGAEVREPGFASSVMVETYATQIAVLLSRELNALEGAEAHAGGLAPWRLRAIDGRIADMDEAPTLLELAELSHLSVRQLSRAFRASRGVSIGRYITEKRLEKAKAMLMRGESVSGVAHRLGFSSSASFGYAFRRSTGLAPKNFKRTSH